MSKSSLRGSTVDDSDPRVTYSATWTQHGSDFTYGNTLHATSVAGATAKLRFNGTSIEVFGKVEKASSRKAPISSYTLEDGTLTTFRAVETSDDQYHVSFFKKEGLLEGEHVLVIKNLVSNDALLLDYFAIDSGGDSQSPSSNPPTAVIVGAALGALFATLSLLLMGFFFWTRIQERRRKSSPNSAHIYTHVRNTSHQGIQPPVFYPQHTESTSRISTSTPSSHPTITPYNLYSRNPDPPTWIRPFWSVSNSSTSLHMQPQNLKTSINSNTHLPPMTLNQDSGSSRTTSSLSGPVPNPPRSQRASVSPQAFPPPYSMDDVPPV